MISVGRRRPPTSNRHVPIQTLADLDVLRDVDFDSVIFIVGNTDHHRLERPELTKGEPNAFDYHTIPLLQALEQLKHRPLRKFLHFSTVLIYDEHRITLPVAEDAPIDPYKNRYVLSKYLAEEACKFYAQWVPTINVRMSNLYGPTPLRRFDLIHEVITQLLEEGRAQVWSKKPSRDFIYVEDAARAVVDLMASDYTGTVNLGTGTMTSVSEVTSLLEELTGLPIVDLDQPVSGPLRFRCDTTTLDRVIGWRPQYPIEEGIRRTLDAMRERISA
ncbi:MAG: NAD(P)-dependent oxidoreductase [Actinomycetota bacterium]|nr:NAD(P)-dependent oxidoreductase [Actinomycetota bacterium]